MRNVLLRPNYLIGLGLPVVAAPLTTALHPAASHGAATGIRFETLVRSEAAWTGDKLPA